MQKKNEKPKDLTGSSSVKRLEIPKHLPPIVRDVAESLALRDPELAARYLQTYQQPRHERTDLTGSTRSHLP